MLPKRLLCFLFSLLALFGFASAEVGGGSGGSGAPDDSYWQFPDGDVAHLDVTENPAGGVWTTTTTAGGFSNPANGTQGPDTPSGLTTCRDSGEMVNGSGDATKVIDGKLNKRGSDGKWKRGRKIPKPKTNSRPSSFAWPHLDAGDLAPKDGTLHSRAFGVVQLLQFERAPWAGEFHPSEDVVSLPAF